MKKFKRAIADPIASNPTDDQVVFYTQNELAVPIDSDLYLQLLDDRVSQVKTPDFIIKRRLARTPVRQLPPQRGSRQRNDNNTFYTLCLDVFDLNGQFLGTRIHNLPVPH